MKKHLAIIGLVALVLGLCVPMVLGQASGSVKGVCKDAEGKPIAGGVVLYENLDNGQKYTIKTNAKGEYFSLGLGSGKYKVTLFKTPDDQKAGKELFHYNGFPVQIGDENNRDFDLQKEAESQAKGEGLSAEEIKARQEAQAKHEKEASTVKTLQGKLDAANTAIQNKDYDNAIAALVEANQIDATRDVLWYRLGDAYRLSAMQQTDKAERTKRYDSAEEAYQKAIQIKQDAISAGKEKDAAKANLQLAGFYTNLADAYARSGKVDDAVKSYETAAKTDPTGAAGAYFNIGAVYTNAGRVDDANAAFDKCIATDPNRAEAYYQKGVNLLGKATLQGDKTVAPPGTAEAFQKYLEIAPTGPNAQSAKDLLASIGAPVETSFGTKKKPAKK
ncbi:MAG TPA: tetratricopeptide repeat protein [Candidatus Dormibacteraeota bacterium]|nr:tetratricopeptide repeat protein [Candidatus Dormibacteraeota bacterium]